MPHDPLQDAKRPDAVERTCAVRETRATPTRRILEIPLAAEHARGAYDVLDVLRMEGLGSQPPVAHIALDFLRKHRFLRRIEQLNASPACAHPAEGHASACPPCRSCDLVVQPGSDSATGGLGRPARKAGFRVERVVRGVRGLSRSRVGTSAA